MQHYGRRFYDDLAGTALPSARRIVPMLCDLVRIESVVDIGCGDGSWLAVFRESGVRDVLGIDGEWVAEGQLRIPRDCFMRRRLDAALDIDRRFDLAMSLEVAEHLPAARAAGFIAELCRLAPVVLFSAAIPHQGGLHHLNEQWPSYWTALFADCGCVPVDALRLAVWDAPDVTWWYKQNILLFADADAIAANPRLSSARDRSPLPPPSLVHPEKYAETVHLAEPSFGRWLKMAPAAFRRSLAKKRRQ